MDVNALVYDIEITNAIPDRDGSTIEGIQYCKGWGDHAGMGIATLCAWDCQNHLPLVYCADNLDDFGRNIQNFNTLVSFNGIGFDNKLLAANGINIANGHCYDILREIWVAEGLNPDKFSPRTHGGYGLDRCGEVNFGMRKTGDGAMAPINWQRGMIGNVISYCLVDVMLTRRLFLKIVANEGVITNPKTGGTVRLRMPDLAPQPSAAIEQELLLDVRQQRPTAVEEGE